MRHWRALIFEFYPTNSPHAPLLLVVIEILYLPEHEQRYRIQIRSCSQCLDRIGDLDYLNTYGKLTRRKQIWANVVQITQMRCFPNTICQLPLYAIYNHIEFRLLTSIRSVQARVITKSLHTGATKQAKMGLVKPRGLL